jgi:Transglutaminase-like superfamily
MLAGWRRTTRVPRREWLDYGRAQLALFGALLEVRLRSRGRLLAYDAEVMTQSLAPGQLARAAELELALSRAVRYGIFRPKCLARSVALHRLLLAAGIPGSRIRIGVRRESDELKAHAWVTLADRVVGDDPRFVTRFTEMADARLAGFA